MDQNSQWYTAKLDATPRSLCADMVLFPMLLMETQGASNFFLHVYGAVPIVLRLLHPMVLFDTVDAPVWKKAGRFVSAAGTAGLIVAAAVILLKWNI